MKKDKREQYISNMDLEQAKQQFFQRIALEKPGPDIEEIDVYQALARITAKSVYARISSPHYNAAAMDGIALIAEETYGAAEIRPILLKKEKDYVYVNTGNAVSMPHNAVIMIEDVMDIDDKTIQIIAPAHPWQHIRPVGEDIVAGEMILTSGHKIRPVDIGALLSGGIETLWVYKKPFVGILPTGSELVENFNDLSEGKIPESNSRVFMGLVSEYGGTPNRYSPCRDDYPLLKETILKCIGENDILLINAGASAGTKDYTVKILREIGEVIVHGIAMKPAKPTILAIVSGKPVIGIPGYPVSSYLSFELFVKPLIHRLTGVLDEKPRIQKAFVSRRIVSSLKYEEFVRVSMGKVGGRFIATPLTRGAGVTMSLVQADGIIVIPRLSEGIEAGSEVEVKMITRPEDIEKTVVSIGSHDLIMDEISDMMKLSSAHVGSMGGIMAVGRGECHIAPIHLLDEDTGKYNISYIQKYLKGKKIALIRGLKRLQGFMVQKGNPCHIREFRDLTGEPIVFVNRQRGSGTRILLDYHLKKLGIDPADIKGYEREMVTHMAVAVSVKTGSAHVGLGVESAAVSVGLDFVPFGYENYDFAVPYEYLNDIGIQRFMMVLKSAEFRKRVNAIGGYEFENPGEIVFVNAASTL